MLSKNTGKNLFYLGLLTLIAGLCLDEPLTLQSKPESINPYKEMVRQEHGNYLAANPDTHGLSLDIPHEKLKFILGIGSGKSQLGIENEGESLGPGILRKTSNGYMIADTFNNRVLRYNNEGDTLQTLNFSSDSLLLAISENSVDGSLAVIRSLDGKLLLDKFDSGSNPIKRVELKVKDPEFIHFVGAFQSVYAHDTLYLHNGDKTLEVKENGQTQAVPGLPYLKQDGLFIKSEKTSPTEFRIVLVEADGNETKSFLATSKFDSLKNITSDSTGNIYLQFDHVFESQSQVSGEKIFTRANIVQSYTEKGELLSQSTLDVSSDAEIDQNLEISESGSVHYLKLEGKNFKIIEGIL